MTAMPPLPLTTTAEAHAFAELPPEAQADVRQWLADMQRIDAASHGARNRVVAAVGARRGLKPGAVRVKYDRWKREGWPALVNRRAVRAPALPVAFVQEWIGMVEDHQRERVTMATAHRKLLARLTAWERSGGQPDSEHALPGYHTPPARLRSAGGLPRGWDYSNLSRIASREARRIARSRGMNAWASFSTPKLSTTREGLQPMQFVGLDDMVFDFHVLAPWTGSRGVVRPSAFHAICYATACNVARAFKPQAVRADGTRVGLTKREFDLFLLHLLTNVGYNKHTGTVLFGEMGTANASDHFKEALGAHFTGRVTWDHAGHVGENLRGLVYDGEVKGNPRGKKVESHFSLLHNLFSDLPAQIGRNYLEKPEEQGGLMRVATWFSDQLAKLPPDRAMLLKAPCLEWYSFTSLAHRAIEELVNGRTDHHLGQWRKCGHVVPVLLDSMTPEGRAMLAQKPAALQAMLIACPETRLMSPREVWNARAPQQLTTLKPWEVSLLMHPDESRPVKVRPDHTIEIHDKEIDADDALRFNAARIRNAEGQHIMARPGDEFLALLNPFAADRLILCHAAGSRRGGYLGECPAMPRVSAADREGALRQWAGLQQDMAALRHDLEARVSPEATRRQAAQAANRRVSDTSKTLTTREHAEDERRAALDAAFTPAAAEADAPERHAPNFFAAFGEG